MQRKDKNYRHLLNKAEVAYESGKFLEAFLIQSCLIEVVIKDYALNCLKPIIDLHPELKSKVEGFELARLIDDLLLTGKISKELYGNLSTYRKKRNATIHNVLSFDNQMKFEKELKKTYELGRDMKGFIVDEMIKTKKGPTLADLGAEFQNYFAQFTARQREALDREFGPNLERLMKSFSGMTKVFERMSSSNGGSLRKNLKSVKTLKDSSKQTLSD